MTTFVRSARNDNVLIGFFALVAAVVAFRAQNPVVTAIAAAIALGFVGFGVWLNRQPRWEVRISEQEIVLVTQRGRAVRIGHAEAGGTVAVHKRIVNGRAWSSLVAPTLPAASEISLDGFRLPPGALAAACTANGWKLVS